MIRIINKARLVAFSILVLGLTPYNVSALPLVEEPEQPTEESALSLPDLTCLAKNIYYEARNEPKEGKVAVGVVTLNRVDHPKYPDSICEVVNHRTRNKEGKTICQFSWTCMKLPKPKESDPLWVESIKIAKNLLLGKYKHLEKKYENAHHFHSTSISPGWNLRVVARIGRHIFYH